MNARTARQRARRVIESMLDESLSMGERDLLLSDDAIVHLANAYQEIEHADRSGVPLSVLSDPYDDVGAVLRQRIHDVLVDDDAAHEQLVAAARPDTEAVPAGGER